MTDTGGSPVAVLGGTFDPVHWGHIRPAVELLQALGLSEVRMVPVSVPPHRSQPRADAALRCRLLRLAVEDVPGLVVDDRELRRAGASYTADTLASLRRDLGPRRPLCFIMGSDAFRGLTQWHRWRGPGASGGDHPGRRCRRWVVGHAGRLADGPTGREPG